MAGSTPRLNFAVIGHQDSWNNIVRFVNGLRAPEQERLSAEKIREIYPYLPPRTVFRIQVNSETGQRVNGIFIDTFIDPDKLDIRYTRANIKKVLQAADCAAREGAPITTLGGFTSIVQEGNFDAFPQEGPKFTTGNTLTAALIARGIETACSLRNIDLAGSRLLIVGATGDIGLACVDYFKTAVRQLLLCARNPNRLGALARQLAGEQVAHAWSTSLEELLPLADIVICVASSTGIHFNHCRKNLLVCDAGYPKNLDSGIQHNPDVFLFHGGMGQVNRGYSFSPDYSNTMYTYPAPGIAHGCILEAVVLALENRIENYSSGKGNITRAKMEEIYGLALRHGITPAPFYNANGLWTHNN